MPKIIILTFQKSENAVHKEIWRKISDSAESLVDNYVAGLEMVSDKVGSKTFFPLSYCVMIKEGAGAMLMEETAAQYIIAQECDKYTVGHLEDRHYSFAFTKGIVFPSLTTV